MPDQPSLAGDERPRSEDHLEISANHDSVGRAGGVQSESFDDYINSPSNTFDLVLFQRDTMYDSNTSVHGNDDPGIDHFAVAVATPEPSTFALVSGALLGVGAFRLRRQYY